MDRIKLLEERIDLLRERIDLLEQKIELLKNETQDDDIGAPVFGGKVIT